jgi:Xaa-Pro aminopeptidase
VIGLAAGTATWAAVAGTSANATHSTTTLDAFPKLKGPALDRDRASEIMEAMGLDGLIAATPVNLLYTTGWDSTHLARSLLLGTGGLALIPRAQDRPVCLAMNAFAYYYGFAPLHDEQTTSVFQYTVPGDATPALLPDRQLAPLDAGERNRNSRATAQAKHNGIATGLTEAVRAAAKSCGLERARLGVDGAAESEAERLIRRALPDASVRDGLAAFARLRLVKSSTEVAFMRYAARANAEAVHAACAVVRAGATAREFRARFFAEAALRGGLGAWITIDRISADAQDATFATGQAFMIDAVSTYGGYHGDYGRTIFVGEPAKSMRGRTRAIATAWAEVRQSLRPGITFREIQDLGQDVLRKSGEGTAVRITPHSVGLLHTDAVGIGDIALESGMTLSVDFPVLEVGTGGSAHLEDLTLITASGAEPLNDPSDPVIML